jgi:hypothetical protein
LERPVKDSAALQKALLGRRCAPDRAQVRLKIGVLVRTKRIAWGTKQAWLRKSKPISWAPPDAKAAGFINWLVTLKKDQQNYFFFFFFPPLSRDSAGAPVSLTFSGVAGLSGCLPVSRATRFDVVTSHLLSNTPWNMSPNLLIFKQLRSLVWIFFAPEISFFQELLKDLE